MHGTVHSHWLIASESSLADIVVFGAGRIAEVAKVYIDAHGPHRIVGFTVDASHLKGDSFCGKPLVAWEELDEVAARRPHIRRQV